MGWLDHELEILLYLMVVALAVGMTVFHYVESLSWFDALYLSVITLTTVGYGDISPVSVVGRVFTMIYVFVGIGIIFGFIDVITRARIKLRVERRKAKKNKPKNKSLREFV